MGVQAKTTTNPKELVRRFSAGGPRAFVEAVKYAFEIAGREYHVMSQVPHWLATSTSGTTSDPEIATSEGSLAAAPKKMLQVPPVIVWQARRYPARRRKSTGSGAGGSGRLRDPQDMGVSYTPLPVTGNNDPAQDTATPNRRRVREPGVPPLWDSPDQVPDLFRDQIVSEDADGNVKIDPDVVIDLQGYIWDVFVDFVCIGPQEQAVEDMAEDLMYFLMTAFHRKVMASDTSGWPYEDYNGAPHPIAGKLPPWMASKTVTWQLRQQTVYGVPTSIVDRIRVDVHGRRSIL